MIDLDLEELTLTELLEVETALVSFMLSVLLLRCCHIIVEVSSELYLTIKCETEAYMHLYWILVNKVFYEAVHEQNVCQ